MMKIEIEDFLKHNYLYNMKNTNEREFTFIRARGNLEENNYNEYLYIYNLEDGSTKKLLDEKNILTYIYRDRENILYTVKNKDYKLYNYNLISKTKDLVFKSDKNIRLVTSIDRDNILVELKEDEYKSSLEEEKNRAVYLKDYELYTEMPFWKDGQGVSNFIKNKLGILDLKSSKLSIISEKGIDVSGPIYSKDLKSIVYLGRSDNNNTFNKLAIYEYNLEKKENKKILAESKYSIIHVDYLEGEIVFFGSDDKKYGIRENDDLHIVKKTGIEKITSLDMSVKTAVNSDGRYKKGKTIKVSKDRIYFTVTKDFASQILSLDLKGRLREETNHIGTHDDYLIIGEEIIYIGIIDMGLQEFYSYKDNKLRQISSINEAYVKSKNIIKPKEINYFSNGYDITGFVLEAKDYDKNKKYPAIFFIHGGPNNTYGRTYYHDMQVFANQGYFVFFTNPHGSAGRGNEFADLRGRYGSIDYQDLMTFTDRLMEEYEAIDEKRLGVIGGSYGGFMTNWIIGHTDRFKCAVSEKGISNWFSKITTTDIGFTVNLDQQGTDLWEDPKKLWDHSPLKYANRVKTPTFFIHGEKDYRCWISESIQMYSALKYFNVDTEILVLKDESHGYNISGKPRNRIKRLEDLTSWFENYLK